jgi:hypothetical protein
MNINTNKNRQLAAKILGYFMYQGEFYYEMEDWLTKVLSGEDIAPPLGIDSEYYVCALRLEIIDFFNSYESEAGVEDIEDCVNTLLKSDVSLLNMEAIEDVVQAKLKERGEL